MAVLLNKSDMAESIGISVQAFDKWGVVPTERRGREVLYDVRSVLDAWQARQQKKQQAEPTTADNAAQKLLLARIALTEEQAKGQQLKNQESEGRVVDTDFCIFALNRIAMELSSILDSIPLAVQRQCPDISPHHVDFLKLQIAKGANCCANAGDKLPEWLDEYLSISAE